jgi:c-di-GMP-binding flagellar brake protein YcgR
MQPHSEALALGKRLEIGIGEDAVKWFATRVEDSPAEGLLTVAWPTDPDRRLLPLTPGTPVEVAVSHRDAMYSATAVVEHAVIGAVPLIKLAVEAPWRRTQRRQAVRARVAIRPRMASIVYGDAHKPLRLGITNLSASGIQVRSQDEVRRGDLLHLTFSLPGNATELQLQARITRVHRHERVWVAGCEFESVSERLAQRIFQFIFAQEQALARAARSTQ